MSSLEIEKYKLSHKIRTKSKGSYYDSSSKQGLGRVVVNVVRNSHFNGYFTAIVILIILNVVSFDFILPNTPESHHMK